MPEHDPMLCFCGTPEGCSCPCDNCNKLRARDLAIERQRIVLDRLTALDINIEDLADLVWMAIEQDIEKRIERYVVPALREKLRRLVLKSSIEWDNIR